MGLVSNKEVFSFSVKICDLNVVFDSTTCPACDGLGRRHHLSTTHGGLPDDAKARRSSTRRAARSETCGRAAELHVGRPERDVA